MMKRPFHTTQKNILQPWGMSYPKQKAKRGVQDFMG